MPVAPQTTGLTISTGRMESSSVSVLEHKPKPISEVAPLTTKGKSFFKYSVAPRGKRVILLTTGFTACVGEWYGEYGEYFVGWFELPDRDKDLEKEMGLSWINLIRNVGKKLLRP